MCGPERQAVDAHRLDHVGLSVPDLDRAVEFFVAHFGARQLFCLGRSPGTPTGAERLGAPASVEFALAMLEVGTARLELLQWWSDRPSGWLPEADQAGASHVAVEVPDVAAALDHLRRVDGVAVVGELVEFARGETPGLTNAFVRAPWGTLIELVHWTDV